MFCRAVNGRLVVLDIEPSSVADEDVACFRNVYTTTMQIFCLCRLKSNAAI